MSDHVSSARSDAPRRVDLAIARIDAWTVMKVSFLLSVALGIAMVVATIVLWLMVDAMHVFSQIEEFLQTVGAGRFADLLDYARLPRVISYATIVAVINGRLSGGRRQGVPHGRVRALAQGVGSRRPLLLCRSGVRALLVAPLDFRRCFTRLISGRRVACPPARLGPHFVRHRASKPARALRRPPHQWRVVC